MKTDAEIRDQWVGEWVTIQSLTQHGMHLRTFTARIKEDPMFIFYVYDYNSPDLNRLKRLRKDVNWQQTSINGLNIPVMLMKDEKSKAYRIDWDAMKQFEALAEKEIVEENEPMAAKTDTTEPAPAPLGLYRKMAVIMGEIKGIGKKGKNEHFKYSFARAEDVTNIIRLKLSEHGIAFFASMTNVQQVPTEKKTSKGVPYMKTLATFEFTFVDGETTQERTSTWLGEADADDDKGVNKASTAAEKYFLLKTFLIHTGDQVDADSEGPLAWYDDQRQVNELIRMASERLDPSLDSEEALIALLDGMELSNFPTRGDAAKTIKNAWDERSFAAGVFNGDTAVITDPEPVVMDKAVVLPTAQEVAANITDIDDIGKDIPEFMAILDEVWQDESIRNLYDGVFKHFENSLHKLQREGRFTESDTTEHIKGLIRAHKNANGAWTPTNQEIMALSKKLQSNFKISLERVINLSGKKSLAEFGNEANVIEAAKALTQKQKSA